MTPAATEINVRGVPNVTHATPPYLVRAAADWPRGVADLVTISSTTRRVARPASSVPRLGPGTSVRAAEPIWDRSHVVRLHLATGRSVVMKKRAGKDTSGVERAAPGYLNGMPEPVVPRLLGADAGAGILLMEDLGPGPSLAGSLPAGGRSRVRADLVSDAGALGSMHAWSMGRPRDPRLGGRGKPSCRPAAAVSGRRASIWDRRGMQP